MLEMQKIALARDGVCLSDEYVNSATPLQWECAEGHRWWARPNLVKRGTWCPSCARPRQGGGTRSQTYAIEDLRELAAARGGECLSDTYDGVFARYRWRCAHDHEWEATADSIRQGSWCRRCHRQRVANDIDKMREFARAHGWECLSDAVESNKTGLQWRCARGHEWASSYNCLSTRPYCPQCGEEDRKAALLEECRTVAASWGGRCLSREFLGTAAFMDWECGKGHRWQARAASVKGGSWCPTCYDSGRRGTIAQMQELAASRGGRCLSTAYISSTTMLRWRCGKGHEWEAVPSSVRYGTWCPVCSHGHPGRHTIEGMHALAAAFGGKCLSAEYVNMRVPLEWECAAGHRWKAPFIRVRVGVWCRQCYRPGPARLPSPAAGAGETKRVRRTRAQITAALQALVEEKGGRCLSPDFESTETVLILECAAGHKWRTKLRKVLAGSWCPACAQRKTAQAARDRSGVIPLDDVDEVLVWAEGIGLTYVETATPCTGRYDFFRCAAGHLWEVPRPYSADGSWCPRCGTRGEELGTGRVVR
ncbi:MAG: hypothetical protein RBU45_14420 [Myxococcota bacterium]|jgi:hypothetical protein|nr:hypothetical protein [Myxococcota bacterium]